MKIPTFTTPLTWLFNKQIPTGLIKIPVLANSTRCSNLFIELWISTSAPAWAPCWTHHHLSWLCHNLFNTKRRSSLCDRFYELRDNAPDLKQNLTSLRPRASTLQFSQHYQTVQGANMHTYATFSETATEIIHGTILPTWSREFLHSKTLIHCSQSSNISLGHIT